MDWLTELLGSESFRGLMIFAGVLVAVVSVWTARNTARKKQVADMLFASRGDERLQLGCRAVRALHDAPGKNLRTLLDDPEHKDEIDLVKYVLNHFETVGVGIRNGIYDENMVKDAWCTMMINTFEYARPLVDSMRTKHAKDTIFQEYELLVVRWKANPVKARKSW